MLMVKDGAVSDGPFDYADWPYKPFWMRSTKVGALSGFRFSCLSVTPKTHISPVNSFSKNGSKPNDT